MELCPMTDMEKEEFVARMKALSEEEMKLLVDIIPVNMCLERIGRELSEAETFRNSIKNIVKGV